MKNSGIRKTLENDTSVAYAYDNANRLLSIVHKQDTTTFASFEYGYNSIGNRTSVTREDGKSDLYDYDPTDQLTNVAYNVVSSTPEREVGYVYDAVGNRESVTDNGLPVTY